MNYQRLALVVGVAALGISLVAIVAPGLLAFDLDRTVVSLLGAVVLVQALRVVQARRNAELDEATTPDPELPVATDPPGASFDDVLEQFLDSQVIYYQRTRVREGLRSAAVAVLTRYGAYSEAEAEAAVENGTWTDDPDAAAFLGDEERQASLVRTLLRNVARRGSAYRRDVRRTVDAIADAAGVIPEDGDRGPASRGRDGGRASAEDGDVPDRVSTRRVTSAAVDDETGDVVVRGTHATGRWRGVSAVALVGIGVGVLVEQPAVLLAGVVGIGFAAYARSAAFPPGDATVAVERTLSADRPDPGEEVEVTVTVTNEGDRFLPDLRFVDGVPEALAVADGSPRLGTALRPGESATFTYAITARRGVHAFGPTLLVARDLTGAREQKRLLAAETTLTCVPPLRPLAEPVPLREQAAQSVGRVATANGGDGIEFHATREYRAGDAMSRIDWNRRARTGELTTIEFREEDAATIVLVIDAREAAYVSPDGRAPHAVDRAVDAAGRLFATLTRSGDRVGVAALGSESCWLAPNAGPDHRLEARRLLATHPALASVPEETPLAAVRGRKRLRKRLSSGTQIIFLSPLCDEVSGRFARRLDEYGYPVTVVSPDPTADRTNGHRLATVARRLRVSSLRSAEIPVVDWTWDEPIDAALARHDERWSG